MLVLSRKENESIVINNNITIVVVEIRGGKVRLGVEAPMNIPVHRREIWEEIRLAKKATPKKKTRTSGEFSSMEETEEDGPALPNPT